MSSELPIHLLVGYIGIHIVDAYLAFHILIVGFWRAGLPLTMSLVYMELAKRVGLPMQGV